MEQLGLEFAPRKRTFSVSEVTAIVRKLLEHTFDNCWVSGEISNARRAPSGHYYFTLKDESAQLSCVCVRQNALYLKAKPKDGMEIVARGRISGYEARGQYQLYVEAIEPQGYGALQMAFEDLKRKLAEEGLFEDERKLELPRFPVRVGIVTSPSGAAIATRWLTLGSSAPSARPIAAPKEYPATTTCFALGWAVRRNSSATRASSRSPRPSSHPPVLSPTPR